MERWAGDFGMGPSLEGIVDGTLYESLCFTRESNGLGVWITGVEGLQQQNQLNQPERRSICPPPSLFS